MKTLRNILCLVLVAVLLTACSKVKEEAEDVVKEVGELTESVKETGEEMVDGAKRAVDDAKEALEKTKETVDGLVDGVEDTLGKAKDSVEGLIPDGEDDESEEEETEEAMKEAEVEEKEEEVDEVKEEPISGTYNYESGTLKWKGEKIGGAHEGTIDIKSGVIEVENGEVAGGEFVIDMTTVNVTDLEGDSKTGLENKLEGEGYFDAANHSEALLTITGAVDGGIQGDLTIKGIGNPVEFPAEVIIKADKVKLGAEFSIDRTKWEIASGNPVLKKNIQYWVDVVLTK